MQKKCLECRLVNYPRTELCVRCGAKLPPATHGRTLGQTIVRRAWICFAVCLIVIAGFYLSLIGSAKALTLEQKQSVARAIDVLRAKGFAEEVFLLEHLTAYRSEDNWLNASVPKENAYAATNFPFEIMTLYEDFFTYPRDDVERAAILLHEAKHLQGKDEHDAYEFVWKYRSQLGWTREHYRDSPVWHNTRNQTRELVSILFVCDFNEAGDCTETPR